MFNGLEEAGPFGRIVAELMAEDAKRAGGVVETAGHFDRKQLLAEEAAPRTAVGAGIPGRGRTRSRERALSDYQY